MKAQEALLRAKNQLNQVNSNIQTLESQLAIHKNNVKQEHLEKFNALKNTVVRVQDLIDYSRMQTNIDSNEIAMQQEIMSLKNSLKDYQEQKDIKEQEWKVKEKSKLKIEEFASEYINQ